MCEFINGSNSDGESSAILQSNPPAVKATAGANRGEVAPGPLKVAFAVSASTADCERALGARSIRPDIEVRFNVLNTWYDPQAERAAVQASAQQGVGAIYVITIAPVPAVEAAERANLFVLSHFGDLSQFAPTRWLTGTERLWSHLYHDVTRRLLDRTGETPTYRGGLKEGYVRLATFGPAVPPEAIGRVRDLTKAIIAGALPLFRGPLRDNRTELRVPADEVASWTGLLAQNWMVEGIVPLAAEDP